MGKINPKHFVRPCGLTAFGKLLKENFESSLCKVAILYYSIYSKKYDLDTDCSYFRRLLYLKKNYLEDSIF